MWLRNASCTGAETYQRLHLSLDLVVDELVTIIDDYYYADTVMPDTMMMMMLNG